jgi:asparagine synthase (glutamine-hydrolysing)
MCGIAGLLAAPGRFDEAELARRVAAMTCALAHRGPDAEGMWVDAEAGLALGHRRLSILDLSAAAGQPMFTGSGRFAIVFNGEIYNYSDLRRELLAAGRALRTTSDTEVLIEGVEEWGLDATLDRANGMFAFALWDRRERRLHLVRDRLGQKPIYWGKSQGLLLFASELKAFFALPGYQPEIDRDALTLMLRRGNIPAPYSILAGVSKLPPGAILSIDAGRIDADAAPRRYWSALAVAEAGAAEPYAGSEAQAVEELEALIADAVRIATVSDVPVGAFLSGGVDSATVVALLQHSSREPVRTFTIGFVERRYDESERARAIARELGTLHVETVVTAREALAVVPRLPEIYDEPFADSSQIPTHLLARMTRDHVTVALSGDGGDELFGGYENYRLIARLARLARLPRWMRRSAGRALCRLPGGRAGDGAGLRGRRIEKLRRLGSLLAGTGTLADMHRWLLSTWKTPSEVVLGASEPPSLLTRTEDWPAIAEPVRRAMALDLVTYLHDDILVKVDRAAMAVSLETRIPLLDHRLVELATRLPLSFHLRDGKGKWILRRVLARHLPESMFEGPKMGFSVPLDAWLRGELRDWAEGLLGSSRLHDEGFFAVAPIREKWQQHVRGANDWGGYLWPVLMVQAWKERWFDTAPARRANELAAAPLSCPSQVVSGG